WPARGSITGVYGNDGGRRHRIGRFTVLYAHLSRVRVRAGELLQRDEPIGKAGCTGWCTGTHLHFEVRRGGRTLNPLRMLAGAR
ncbi:MAG TPA: M23 family metallopeptidase, partial [Gaiellaceae bacterium]|nr:M23 family metallopeptidase [Gaiellaceae bacterium]